MTFVRLGALSAFVAVAAGAFGAHGLRGRLPADLLSVFETAARYQLFHALALVLVGVLIERAPARPVRAAGWLFVIGTVLFSGSLYALALTGTPLWGAVTPFGGLGFLTGWLALAFGAGRARVAPAA